MSKPEMLYHYTDLPHVKLIIGSGRIIKSPSHLLKRRNLRCIPRFNPGTDESPCDICSLTDPEADKVKPVVWMTDNERPEGIGRLDYQTYIRISIPMQRHYQQWYKWAKKNNMAPHLMRELSKGLNWKSWYVSEFEIPLDDVSEILDTSTNTIKWKGHLIG